MDLSRQALRGMVSGVVEGVQDVLHACGLQGPAMRRVPHRADDASVELCSLQRVQQRPTAGKS